jgi:cobalt-zinc-cadmium efflux system protein
MGLAPSVGGTGRPEPVADGGGRRCDHGRVPPDDAASPAGPEPVGGDGPKQVDDLGHDHTQAHGHSHGVSVRAGARFRNRLWAVVAILAVFLVVEVVGALVTNSLSLLSDAGHMLTDLVGIGMALAAIHVADRPVQRSHRTFGLYRLEILAALANAVLLFAVGIYVLFEAVSRLRNPEAVHSGIMLVVAIAGGVANIVCFALLRSGAEASLNVKGAYLEVLADLLTSLGVVIAALIIAFTGWEWVDPVIGAGIGLFIFPRTWKLGAQAIRVLVEAAPPHLDVDAVRRDLGGLDGVIGVHDLHVWTLTSEMDMASAHLVVADETETHGVLDRARDLLRVTYRIDHATLQVEPESHTGCDEVDW